MAMRSLLLAGAALAALSGAQAQAGVTITASLFSPLAPSGAILTPIALSAIATPTQTNYATPDYSVAFSGVPSDQGIVQGQNSSRHAVPVAGVDGSGNALYLSGDYGSALTANNGLGKYFSTDTGTITLTFASAKTSLALLWGSIDIGNAVTLGSDTVTGAQVQSAASGFASNGFQGPAGSAYVVLTDSNPFTTVSFTSNVTSFEFAAVVGSNKGFNVPEPASLAVLALGVGALGLVRRRAA